MALQFFLLAPCVAVDAVLHLLGGERPETSWLGMALVTSSVIGMPLLGVAKVGLVGNALFGLWWLDPVAALVIAAVAVREGMQTWRGEGCSAAPELTGAACDDDCCD